jgi:DNA-binding NarL/FixJ family response regulator
MAAQRSVPLPVGVVSNAAELRRRITMTLIDAGLEIAGESTDPDLIDNREQRTPGAVVVALSGNPSTTTAALKALGRRFHDVPLLAVIPTAEAERGRAAISAGADGVVLDSDLGTALAATIAAAENGQIAFPERLLRAPDEPSFSLREKQALGMVVLGFTNQEIAATLRLAESTVKGHLSSAFAKLRVSSRAEAAALILDPAHGPDLAALEIEENGGRKVRPRSAKREDDGDRGSGA